MGFFYNVIVLLWDIYPEDLSTVSNVYTGMFIASLQEPKGKLTQLLIHKLTIKKLLYNTVNPEHNMLSKMSITDNYCDLTCVRQLA